MTGYQVPGWFAGLLYSGCAFLGGIGCTSGDSGVAVLATLLAAIGFAANITAWICTDVFKDAMDKQDAKVKATP